MKLRINAGIADPQQKGAAADAATPPAGVLLL